jgi:hypothetical protein
MSLEIFSASKLHKISLNSLRHAAAPRNKTPQRKKVPSLLCRQSASDFLGKVKFLEDAENEVLNEKQRQPHRLELAVTSARSIARKKKQRYDS